MLVKKNKSLVFDVGKGYFLWYRRACYSLQIQEVSLFLTAPFTFPVGDSQTNNAYTYFSLRTLRFMCALITNTNNPVRVNTQVAPRCRFFAYFAFKNIFGD
jgi:hypothetical protein